MEEIIEKIKTLKEDKPHLIITEDIIKQYIEDDIDFLIKDIEKGIVY